MTLPRHNPGDRDLEAWAWNAAMAATEAWQQAKPLGPDATRTTAHPPIPPFYLRNATGADLPAHTFLTLGAPRWAPSDEAYRRQPYLDGTVPSDPHHNTPFALLLQPLSAGAVTANVATHGLTSCKVNLLDTAHEYAELTDGVTLEARSGPAGPIRIHHAAHTSGSDWALVELRPSGHTGPWPGTAPSGIPANATGSVTASVLVGSVTAKNIGWPVAAGGDVWLWRVPLPNADPAYICFPPTTCARIRAHFAAPSGEDSVPLFTSGGGCSTEEITDCPSAGPPTGPGDPLFYDDLADLPTPADYFSGQQAYVTNDPTPANRGLYLATGPTGGAATAWLKS